jgi:hypothetical protein
MPSSKEMKRSEISLGLVDKIHVYSSPEEVWLQLRRDISSARELANPSYKIAVPLTVEMAIQLVAALNKAVAQVPKLKEDLKIKKSKRK